MVNLRPASPGGFQTRLPTKRESRSGTAPRAPRVCEKARYEGAQNSESSKGERNGGPRPDITPRGDTREIKPGGVPFPSQRYPPALPAPREHSTEEIRQEETPRERRVGKKETEGTSDCLGRNGYGRLSVTRDSEWQRWALRVEVMVHRRYATRFTSRTRGYGQ